MCLKDVRLARYRTELVGLVVIYLVAYAMKEMA